MSQQIKSKIPKLLHYCWFGPEKMNSLNKRCLRSWEKHLSDYELIKWDETNVNIDKHPFLKVAYSQKKWAFVADFVRLQKLFDYGGVYLDTDMFVVKPFDFLEDSYAFFGSENEKYINASIVGSVRRHPFIQTCLSIYDQINLDTGPEWQDIAIPRLITSKFRSSFNYNSDFTRKVEVPGIIVYPVNYFYSLPFEMRGEKKIKGYIGEKTYALHLWDESWKNYDEFYHLRRGNYKKGFQKAFKGGAEKWSMIYVRKIFSAIRESIKRF
ncbi:mannosyltransferase [Salinimicrobium sp. CDJ15-81-2]|nr:mannosyltransferase [Salinimicrobium nanhaiense]